MTLKSSASDIVLSPLIVGYHASFYSAVATSKYNMINLS